MLNHNRFRTFFSACIFGSHYFLQPSISRAISVAAAAAVVLLLLLLLLLMLLLLCERMADRVSLSLAKMSIGKWEIHDEEEVKQEKGF